MVFTALKCVPSSLVVFQTQSNPHTLSHCLFPWFCHFSTCPHIVPRLPCLVPAPTCSPVATPQLSPPAPLHPQEHLYQSSAIHSLPDHQCCMLSTCVPATCVLFLCVPVPAFISSSVLLPVHNLRLPSYYWPGSLLLGFWLLKAFLFYCFALASVFGPSSSLHGTHL